MLVVVGTEDLGDAGTGVESLGELWDHVYECRKTGNRGGEIGLEKCDHSYRDYSASGKECRESKCKELENLQ